MELAPRLDRDAESILIGFDRGMRNGMSHSTIQLVVSFNGSLGVVGSFQRYTGG